MFSRKAAVVPFNADIRTGGVGALLAKLLRIIFNNIHLEQDRYSALMANYLRKKNLVHHRHEKTVARAGLSRELLKESITWKTWVKGLEFLNFKHASFTILPVFSNRAESRHSFSFNPQKVTTPGPLLGAFYHQIEDELGLSAEIRETLMETYLQRSLGSVTEKARAAAKAGVTKDLQKRSMTWKTFIKGLVFLGIVKFTIDLVLTHPGGSTSVHQMVVSLDDFKEEDESEDD